MFANLVSFCFHNYFQEDFGSGQRDLYLSVLVRLGENTEIQNFPPVFGYYGYQWLVWMIFNRVAMGTLLPRQSSISVVTHFFFLLHLSCPSLS